MSFVPSNNSTGTGKLADVGVLTPTRTCQGQVPTYGYGLKR